jgi:hypothetical protein
MSRKDVAEKLIEELKLTQTRPAMYIGETTVLSMRNYLSGMYAVLVLIGIVFTSEIRHKAITSRGWETSSTGAVADMQAHGLSEWQMVQELLLIEIKMLELVAEGLAD